MARYSVNASVIGSTHIGIYEADSEEEAIEMAAKDASVSVCYHCARKIEDPEIGEITAELIKE